MCSEDVEEEAVTPVLDYPIDTASRAVMQRPATTLSYRMIAEREFELSADTDGWVAVGSSDKKMVRHKSWWKADFSLLLLYHFRF